MAITPTMPVRWKQNPTEAERISFIHEIMATPLPAEHKLPKHSGGFRLPHTQDYYELIFFCAGIRDIMVGDKAYTLRAGDIIAIRPGEPHCGRSHTCILDRYYLHIGKNALCAFGGASQFLLQIFQNDRENRIPVFHCSPDVNKQIIHLLEKIDFSLRFCDADSGGAEAFAHILHLLTLLNRHYCPPVQRPQKKSALLLKILAYMETSCTTQTIWQEIYTAFGVSKTGLWRMFKTEMQTTPAKHLQFLRLENARLMLEQGAGVTEACMDSGFNDCSHFIRLFRQTYGSTPLKYKYKTQ